MTGRMSRRCRFRWWRRRGDRGCGGGAGPRARDRRRGRCCRRLGFRRMRLSHWSLRTSRWYQSCRRRRLFLSPLRYLLHQHRLSSLKRSSQLLPSLHSFCQPQQLRLHSPNPSSLQVPSTNLPSSTSPSSNLLPPLRLPLLSQLSPPPRPKSPLPPSSPLPSGTPSCPAQNPLPRQRSLLRKPWDLPLSLNTSTGPTSTTWTTSPSSTTGSPRRKPPLPTSLVLAVPQASPLPPLHPF